LQSALTGFADSISMSDKYLLPCNCGQTVVIEPRQAGSMVTCVCGKSLEAPTIRAMTHLSRAEVEEELPPLWTLRHGLIFLGLAIAIPAFVFASYLYYQIPTLQDSDYEEYIMQFTPAQSWALWQIYSHGMPKSPSPETRAMIEGIQSLHRWITLGVAIGIAGLFISASAFLIPKQGSEHQRPKSAPRR
jgi:hypothetical protein